MYLTVAYVRRTPYYQFIKILILIFIFFLLKISFQLIYIVFLIFLRLFSSELWGVTFSYIIVIGHGGIVYQKYFDKCSF